MMPQIKSPDRQAPVQSFNSILSARPHHTEATPKKAVPFANLLQGQSRVLLFAGGNACWNQARLNNLAGRDAVALPPIESLDSRCWACVHGRSVVIIELKDTGHAGRNALADHLEQYGAREVALIPFDRDPQKAVFRGLA